MITDIQTYGITLPITHGSRGYFNQSRSVSEQVKHNLNMLLRTKKGERRMNPEFGSSLWNVLFEQNTEFIGPLIDSTIRKDISTWMAYVNVDSVDINRQPDNSYNRINVSVKYTVPSAGILDQQVLNIETATNSI